MKGYFKSLLAIASLAICLDARAQFISGPATYETWAKTSFTNALTVAASATTNLPVTVAREITVGSGGFGVQVYASAAGTSLATNTLAFEFTGAGTNYVNTLPLMAVFVTNGTTTAVSYFTNFPSSLATVGNIGRIRLKYITNSSAQITYWTNITITTR